MTYLVMECHPAYAVVLSGDGQFLKVANLHYEVGQQVTQVVQMQLPEPAGRKQLRRWIPALVSAAACLALMLGSVLWNFMPYASVYMAINPQVRIDVSRTDRVVEVTGVNEDGVTLLTDYDPGGQTLDQVMDELVDRAIDMGYLHEGGKIALTLDADAKWVSSHEQALNSHLAAHLSDRVAVTIDITFPDQPGESTPTQPAETAPTTRPTTAVPESDYDESDYSTPEHADSGYEESGNDGQTDHDADDDTPYRAPASDSHYGDSHYGDSSYDGHDHGSDYD